MRISRFSRLDAGRGAEAGLPLLDCLIVDFRRDESESGAAVAGERARALLVSLPLLTAAHLLWCALLVFAFVADGKPVPAVTGGLAIGVLGLDLGLRRLLRHAGLEPHQAVCAAAGHNVACAALWLLAGHLLAATPGGLPLAAQFALLAGAGATLPAFFVIPALAMLACLVAFAAAVEIGIPPTLLGAGGAFGLLLSSLSLLRARDWTVQAARRLRLEAEAKKARRFVDDFEASGRGWFWETNADGMLAYASEALAGHLGVEAPALIGRRFGDLLMVEEEGEDRQSLFYHLTARFPFADLAVRAAGGETSWLLSGTPNFDPYGRFLGFRGLGTNLSEQRRSDAEKSKLAHTDSLTGLPNRAAMRATLDAALANAAERRQGCALMLIDLDRFKQVNDTLGHPVGDKLLTKVAERLQRVLGQAGQVGRLGGDEFEAVLPGLAEEGRLGALAEALIGEISRPYSIGRHQVVIGASVGVAIARPGKAWADGLVKEADLALYAAKHDGRGTWRLFRDEMHEQEADRQVLEEDLRHALARDQLRLVYQPIVDAVSEEPVAFEALLRWHHPTRGVIPPLETIPLAEEAGLIGGIGDWVIRSACAEAARWPDHVRIAVNLSPAQLADPALPAIVTSALAASGIDAERLELEVGEAAFTEEHGSNGARLAALRALGVRLALDNFGTGRCSLGHLRDAPLDKIKVDRSFVRGAAEPGSRNAAIVRAIVVLAESLGMDTTAEGAETLEELALIRRLGCSQVQGFIFSQPVSSAEAQALAADSRATAEVVGFGRPPRHRLIRTGSLRIGDETIPVRLRNISEGGAMVECDRQVAAGAVVALDLDAAGIVAAEVRWCQRGQIGLAFERRFPLGRLARSNRRPGTGKMLQPDYLQPDAAPPGAPRPSRSPLAAKRRL